MKIFKGSVTFLLIGVIAIMAFFNKPEQHRLMIGFFTLWSLFHLIRLVIRFILKPKPAKSKPVKVKHAKKEKKNGDKKLSVFGKRNRKDTLVSALMLHVNCRISDKLKSAYPDATWSWCVSCPVELLTNGGIGRIKTANTKEYNQADVTIDKYGRISFIMLKAEPLNNAVSPDENKPETADSAAVWYTATGQNLISAIVVELNTHGHQTMYIKENGDVVTVSGDTETKHDALKDFPENAKWGELMHMFSNDGLHAEADDGYTKIKVSW